MMLLGDFFDLQEYGHQDLFQPNTPVRTILGHLQDYLASFLKGQELVNKMS